jgi:GTP 3',8-cyclase
MTSFQLDSHKLFYHLPILLKWVNKESIYPMAVSIGPTRACNYKCIFCAYRYLENNTGFLDLKLVSDMAEQAGPYGVKSFFFSGDGEPLLHPELPDCIARVKASNIDVALNTNGSLLSKEVARKIFRYLSWIRISVNAGNKEEYGRLHGCSPSMFDKVLNNLSKAAEEKKKLNSACTIGVQSILLPENLTTLYDLGVELKKIGVNYFALKPFLKHPSIDYNSEINYNDPKIIELLQRIENLATNSFKVIIRWNSLEKIKLRSYKRCLSFPFFVDIDSRGDVFPCGPMIGEKKFCYGNLYEKSFEQIWNSKERNKLETWMINDFDCKNCMPNCRNDAVNRTLWSLRNYPEHLNFI